ncbi:MAG: hypothetical protein GX208_01185 [Firmicutes bacterium]|nr:hypothetical protein [Bacillota bacterium]
MRNLSKTIRCHILWGISTLFSFYLVFVLNEFVVLLMEAVGWNKHTINVIDKFFVLVIGVFTVAFFLYIQHAYQHKAWFLFFLVSSIQILVYGLVAFGQQVLLNQYLPVLQIYDYVFLILSLGLSGLLAYLYIYFKSKQKIIT